MEKQSKAPLIYGYAVCLVSVITIIICIAGLVNAVIDRGDPLHAERCYNNCISLASFENYKMDLLTSSDKEFLEIPEDETLRAMYEAAKEEKILGVKHRTTREIMVNGLLIVICSVLFFTHWRWMKKLSKEKS